jgi:hypothetical protein
MLSNKARLIAGIERKHPFVGIADVLLVGEKAPLVLCASLEAVPRQCS